MPDGLTNISSDPQVDKKVESEQRSQLARQKPFLVWAGVAFLGLSMTLAYHFYVDREFLDSSKAKMLLTLASVSLWFPLIMLFRDTEDNFGHGPSWRLPVVSLMLLLLLTSFVVVEHSAGHPLFVGMDEDRNFAIALFFAALFLIFGAPAYNAAIYHKIRKKAKSHVPDKEVAKVSTEFRDAEAMSALVATLVVGTILGLAVFAGEQGQNLKVSSIIGIGLCVSVVTVFAAVIFSEPLSQLGIIRSLANGSKLFIILGRLLDSFYSGIDSFFVRIGSFVAGMEQRAVFARYGILSTSLICLCVMSWYLPAPLGMIPAALGLFLAVSVSRLWSWAEHDRAMAVLTKFKKETPSRLDRKEDYRDETLLGFIFIFALLPIIMCQLHFGAVFSSKMFLVPAEEPRFLEWLAFFGVELAKAVPIVDWAEIYQIQETQGGGQIALNDKYSRHAVFLARATVDLVLIAALLQAVAIAGRNRQQKQLYRAGLDPDNRYKAGLLDRLDQFLEDAELKRAVKYTLMSNAQTISSSSQISSEEANKRHFKLSLLTNSELTDFRRYNEERLYELHVETNDPLTKIFIRAIEYERPGFTLKTRLQLLEEYAEGNRPESDLYGLLQGLEKDIAGGLVDKTLALESIKTTLFELKDRSGLKDLKASLLSLIPELLPQVPVENVMEMLADVAGRSSSNRDKYQYARKKAINQLVDIAVGSEEILDVKRGVSLVKDIASKQNELRMKRIIDGALSTLSAELSKRA